MQIPDSNILSTNYLNSVFDNTVATYKYYWFLSILDLCVKHGKTRMDVWEIMILMVVKAWYPVTSFRLSFGKTESLYGAIWALQNDYDIPINISMQDLTDLLQDMVFTKKDKEVRNRLNFLQNNVPYRFLHPWIKTLNNNEMLNRSQSFENGCLYKLEKQNGTMWVELNAVWLDYLKENYDILSAFAYRELAVFLQTRNPDITAITEKLVKVEESTSLVEQHKHIPENNRVVKESNLNNHTLMDKTKQDITKVTLDIRRTVKRDSLYYYEVSFGGTLCYVRLYPFQVEMLDVYAKLKQITCVYKGLHQDGTPNLVQDRNFLIDELYEEKTVHEFTYSRTETELKNDFQIEYHILYDSSGIMHRLYAKLPQEQKEHGAKVKVYIRSINPKNKNLNLGLYNPELDCKERTWFDADKVFSEIDELENKEHLFDSYFENRGEKYSNYYREFIQQYNNQSNLWLLAYMNFLDTDVIRLCYKNHQIEEIASVCQLLLKLQKWMVEGSSFLDLFTKETRNATILKATEQINKYNRLLLTVDEVRTGKHYQYIGDIVSSLKKSGRLVIMREERLEVMLNIFRLCPEYITQNLENTCDLIDGLINLEDEKGLNEVYFIARVVNRLIGSNVSKIRKGTVRSNEIDVTQTFIIKEILALLCLLVMIYSSNKYANEIESRTCKAKFFRFLSFISPKDLQPLVIKAGVDALAGVLDGSKIFTWENAKSINQIALSALAAEASILESNTDNEFYFFNCTARSAVVRLDATGFTIVPYKQCQNNAKMNSYFMSRIGVFHHLDSLPLKLGSMYNLKPVSLDLDAVKQLLLWRDITRYPENMLKNSEKPKPQIGDVVRVLVKEQTQPDHLKLLLFVKVQDQKYASVDGILTPKDISRKWLSDCRDLFKAGEYFYAKVYSITEDGKYRFSIRKDVEKYADADSTVEEDVRHVVLKNVSTEGDFPMLSKLFLQELILLVDMLIRKEANCINKIQLIGYAYTLCTIVSDIKSYYYDFLLRYYAVIEKFMSDDYNDVDIELQDITNNLFANLESKKRLVELLSYAKMQDEEGVQALQLLALNESGNDVGKLSAMLVQYIYALEGNLPLETVADLRSKINSLICNPDELDLSALEREEHDEEHEFSAYLDSESESAQQPQNIDLSKSEAVQEQDDCLEQVKVKPLKIKKKSVPLLLNIFDDGNIMITEDNAENEKMMSMMQIVISTEVLSGFILLMNSKGGLCKTKVEELTQIETMSKQMSCMDPYSLINSFVVPENCIVGFRAMGVEGNYIWFYKSEDIPCSSILTPDFIYYEQSEDMKFQPFILPLILENDILGDSFGKKINDSELSKEFIDTLNSYGVYI